MATGIVLPVLHWGVSFTGPVLHWACLALGLFAVASLPASTTQNEDTRQSHNTQRRFRG